AMPRGVEIAFRIVQSCLLAVIVAMILLKPRRFWLEPPHVFAAALALVAWLIIFSPIFWEHYHAYLAPFWGWLFYEATRSRMKMILAILAIGLAYLPSTVLLHQLHRPQLPEPLASHLLWSAVIMLAL